MPNLLLQETNISVLLFVDVERHCDDLSYLGLDNGLADHSCTINIDSSSTNSPITNYFNCCSVTSLRDLYAKVTIGAHAVITTLSYKCQQTAAIAASTWQ